MICGFHRLVAIFLGRLEPPCRAVVSAGRRRQPPPYKKTTTSEIFPGPSTPRGGTTEIPCSVASVPHVHRGDTPPNAGGRIGGREGSTVVLQVESATSEPKPYYEEPARTVPLQGPQTQENTVGPRAAGSAPEKSTCYSSQAPHTRHQGHSHPSTWTFASDTHTRAQLVLERYLGHHPALFTLPSAVGAGLHQMLEERRAQANNMLQ